MVSTEVQRYDDVDTADVPSAHWGWSTIKHSTWHLAGLFIIFFLLMMLHGNHQGHVEDYFLIGFAVISTIFLVRDWWGRRRGWLR